MEFVKCKFQNIFNYYFKSSLEIQYTGTEVGIFEIYLEHILRILHWENKKLTLKIFLLCNHLFWFILLFHIKFYGILSLICLVIFVLDSSYRDKVYAEFNGEYLCIIRDIKYWYYKSYNMSRYLRKESSCMFTISMILFFLVVRMISTNLSGYTLSYIFFLMLFFIPLGFKMLPEEIAAKVKQLIKILRTPKCILAEDELIPFILGKDFSRRDADLDSLLTDRTADSATNSLISGISTMPSYLEVIETSNDIEEEDLLPTQTLQAVTYTPGELSSDSDSDHREIQFDSDHFNTSSSEDDPYSKGLAFVKDGPDGTDGIRGMLNSVMTTVQVSMGGNFVTNMLQTAMTRKTLVKTAISETDSDFEIVNSDEIED